jgi:hypothetical protein
MGANVTPTEFRIMALKLPDVFLAKSHAGKVFHTRGVTIATLGALDPLIGWIGMSARDQARMLEAKPVGFSPEPGVLGLKGRTTIKLALTDPALVREALAAAHRHACAPRPAKPRSMRP